MPTSPPATDLRPTDRAQLQELYDALGRASATLLRLKEQDPELLNAASALVLQLEARLRAQGNSDRLIPYRCPSCLSIDIGQTTEDGSDYLCGPTTQPICQECGWEGDFDELQTFDSDQSDA